MRTLLAVVLVGLLGGCGVELLTTTAIQGELQAEQATAMKRQLEGASDTTAQINIQRAIATYQAEKGKYPASLDELVPGYLPSLPSRPDGTPYAYDPSTGKLIDGPRRNAILNGPTAGDRQKMKQLNQAINSYGQATGYYPPSLDALVPQYISAVPKTDSGENFIFHPENGALLHPAQPATPQNRPSAPARRNAPAVGGAGLMGETMTGIGMQQQLGNMSNAGASSAGSYARGRAGRAVQQQQRQQERALKQLGY